MYDQVYSNIATVHSLCGQLFIGVSLSEPYTSKANGTSVSCSQKVTAKSIFGWYVHYHRKNNQTILLTFTHESVQDG